MRKGDILGMCCSINGGLNGTGEVVEPAVDTITEMGILIHQLTHIHGLPRKQEIMILRSFDLVPEEAIDTIMETIEILHTEAGRFWIGQ